MGCRLSEQGRTRAFASELNPGPRGDFRGQKVQEALGRYGEGSKGQRPLGQDLLDGICDDSAWFPAHPTARSEASGHGESRELSMPAPLSENLIHDPAVDVRQPEVAPGIAIGKLGVV